MLNCKKFVIILFLFFGKVNSHWNRTRRSNTDFDVLIFTQHWPQTVCYTWKEKSTSNTCSLPKEHEWTIHGIWPSQYHKIGPQFCNKLPFNSTALEPLKEKLQEKWIDIEKGRTSYSFWQHEWDKHGTCAVVLEQLNTENKYFTKGLELLSIYDMKNILAKANIIPGQIYNKTEILNAIERQLEIFEFDGVDSAAIVPNDVLEHTLAQKFTIGVWVKHRPRPRQDPHVKEHILCAADDHKMNRHHYALFIRNCRLILLLRRDFSEGDPNIFRPAEWRWKLSQVCDDKWHHYAVQVEFPHVTLFVDGEEWHTDEKNPEVIDDWPLHPAKGVNTTLVVGACWQGSDNKTKHHFRGYLAGLSVLVGRTEKPDVLSCLRRCQEGIHVPSMDLLQPGTQLLTNSDLTEVRIDGDNRTNVETLLRRIGYSNSRRFPTPGRRNFRLETTIVCEGSENNPLPVPTVQSYVTVLPPPRPGITVNGTGYVAREYADFRLGVRVFPDTRVTAGSAARLDACAVSVYPSLNPDHESLGLPGDALRRFRSITARVDRDGVVLSGADTPYNYQQLIRLIMYTNRKPAYYLDRVFKLTCSELSGRFASNEYVQTLAVIHPKEKTTVLPHSTPDEPPIARILEPAPGHVQLSPHHADLPEEYATAALREGNRSIGGATSSHAVTIVAVACICFLVLMAVVGAARVRGAAKRRPSAGDELAAETEMAWDDSALAITVNPMERLTEHDPHHQSQRDEDVDDSGSSDSEDGSYRDDDLDSSDCENDCEINNGRHRRHTSPHDLEWDHRDV